jgi:hypothetical protein
MRFKTVRPADAQATVTAKFLELGEVVTVASFDPRPRSSFKSRGSSERAVADCLDRIEALHPDEPYEVLCVSSPASIYSDLHAMPNDGVNRIGNEQARLAALKRPNLVARDPTTDKKTRVRKRRLFATRGLRASASAQDATKGGQTGK